MSRLSHLLTADADAIDPSAAERERKFRDREAFRMHKVNAKTRGVPFRFTFEQWLAWWTATGHYHERGTSRGQYVMARRGDQGAYEPGNVYCAQGWENQNEAHLGKRRTAE